DMSGMKHDMSTMTHDHHPSLQDQPENPAAVANGWADASTPHGHRALKYSDLQARIPQKDVRPVRQTININLDGNMERYIWTMNGQKFNHATPLKVAYGDRVRLTFHNKTMMAHPMHLHGMFVQLENGQLLQNQPNKHTIIVPPGQTVSVLLTADELGEWAIHCHLLYHMTAGMMNKLIVAQVDSTAHSTPSSAETKSADAKMANMDMSNMNMAEMNQAVPAQGEHHAHH
ncbi:MAG: multicopper oxidase domain-containing protein, partial [Acinetobacter sp.]